MWEKTHYLISDYLHLLQDKEDTEENIQRIKEWIAEEMHDDIELSKKKDFSIPVFWEWGGLSEHYYNEDLNDENVEDVIKKVRENLDRLVESQRIVKIKEYIKLNYPLYIENPKNPNFEAMRVDTRTIPELRDISIMATPDFGITFSKNKFLILDWKTGKEPDHQLWFPDQLKVYALKTLLKKQKSSDIADYEIEAHEVYLPSMNNYWGKILQEDVDDVIDLIIQDTNFQKTFLVDQDPIKNIPVESSAFTRTTDEKKCETCPFRKVCNDLRKFE